MSYEPICVYVKVKTAKAVLVSEMDHEVWIPLSLVSEDDIDCIELHEYNEINVESWFLKKEGLL